MSRMPYEQNAVHNYTRVPVCLQVSNLSHWQKHLPMFLQTLLEVLHLLFLA